MAPKTGGTEEYIVRRPVRQTRVAFYPFVMDTWGALAADAHKVMQGLLKVALSDVVDWRRLQKEANMWQALLIAPMKVIARQLRLHGRVNDEDLVASATSSSHIPYRPHQ